jgi:Asp-tRNA(Asn)/Glu-tRNA(Gln) amidotransferase B subunit
MGYGFDKKDAEWWVNKNVTIRWSNNHADSKTFFFCDCLDFLVSVSSVHIDKETLHTFSTIVTNDLSSKFENDIVFLDFLYEHGKSIIKFIFDNKKNPRRYIVNTVVMFADCNMYVFTTSFDDLTSLYPCEITSDKSQIESWCDEVISSNQKAAEDFKSGKLAALNSLKGKVMKLSSGKCDIKLVEEILVQKLK